jgi:hypothetical protein
MEIECRYYFSSWADARLVDCLAITLRGRCPYHRRLIDPLVLDTDNMHIAYSRNRRRTIGFHKMTGSTITEVAAKVMRSWEIGLVIWDDGRRLVRKRHPDSLSAT